MALTRPEAKRADELEAIASRRDLTEAELREYESLALASHRRVLLARANIEAVNQGTKK